MKLLALAVLLLCGAHAFAQNAVPEASALLRAGKFLEAHRLLSNELQRTSTDVRLYTLDGFALSRTGDARAAAAAYQAALAIAPRYLPALEGAAEAKFALRAPDAEDALQHLLAVQPANTTAHAMLGTLAFERGDCAAAETEFRQSEQTIARQPPSLEARGACLLRLQRSVDAAAVFAALAAQFPERRAYRYNQAVSQLQAGLYRDAIQTLSALPGLENDPDALDLVADARERSGATPEAIATLRRAIILRPGEPRLYLHFADVTLAHHSFQAGVAMLNAGIQRSPDAAPLYLARGILEVQLAQYAEAERDFAQAETLDPASRYPAALQSMTKLQQNQLEPAAEEIRERVRLHPDDAFLQYLLAETLARRGATPGTPEFEEAFRSARKAVALQPNFALARDVLGRLYLQSGDTASAIRESRLAFANDPTDQTALYHLIRALKKAGQDGEVASLTSRLATLRSQAQQKEIEERRYAIVVANQSSSAR